MRSINRSPGPKGPAGHEQVRHRSARAARRGPALRDGPRAVRRRHCVASPGARGRRPVAPPARAHQRHRRPARERAAACCAVLTGADVVADELGGLPPLFMPEDRGGPKGYRTFRPILVADQVRHVGDRVAFVVARDTSAGARSPPSWWRSTTSPCRPSRTSTTPRADGAVRVWDDGAGQRLRAARGWATRRRLTPRLPGPSRGVAATGEQPHLGQRARAPVRHRRLRPDDASFTLYTSTQNPHGVRTTWPSESSRRRRRSSG